MNEQQALDLQIWSYENLQINYCLKEPLESGGWSVLLGLPDGTSRRLDGSPVLLAAVVGPSGPSPRPVRFGLVSDVGTDGCRVLLDDDFLFFKRPPSEDEDVTVFNVPCPCLRGDTFPVAYDALEGRLVLVF